MFASPTCNKRTELRHAGAVKLARIMEFNCNILFFYSKLKPIKYYLIKNNKIIMLKNKTPGTKIEGCKKNNGSW